MAIKLSLALILSILCVAAAAEWTISLEYSLNGIN